MVHGGLTRHATALAAPVEVRVTAQAHFTGRADRVSTTTPTAVPQALRGRYQQHDRRDRGRSTAPLIGISRQ